MNATFEATWVCKRDGPLHGHGPFEIERLCDFHLKYSDMRLGVQKYTIENTETTVVNKKDNISHILMCQQFYCIACRIWSRIGICSTSGQGYDQHMGENLRKTVSKCGGSMTIERRTIERKRVTCIICTSLESSWCAGKEYESIFIIF